MEKTFKHRAVVFILFPTLFFLAFLPEVFIYPGELSISVKIIISFTVLLAAVYFYKYSLVFVWSLFLGIIRQRTKGMLMPVVAHIFADLTIFIILFIFYSS
jgi:hypothetical protein